VCSAAARRCTPPCSLSLVFDGQRWGEALGTECRRGRYLLDCAKNSRIVAWDGSSLIRVNNFTPSLRIVSGRSKGSRSYIFPPAK